MHERQRALGALVAQVGVEGGQLVADQHALVDDRPRGARGDVQAGLARRSARRPGGSRRACARRRPGRASRASCASPAPTNSWRITGRQARRDLARVLLVDRHVAPAEQRAGPRPATVRSSSASSAPARLVLGRQEAHQHAVAPGRRQLEVDDRAQQLVGHLHEDPRAVARARVGAGGAAVLEVLERRDRPRDRPRGSACCPGARPSRRRTRRARSGGRRGRRPLAAACCACSWKCSLGAVHPAQGGRPFAGYPWRRQAGT